MPLQPERQKGSERPAWQAKLERAAKIPPDQRALLKVVLVVVVLAIAWTILGRFV